MSLDVLPEESMQLISGFVPLGELKILRLVSKTCARIATPLLFKTFHLTNDLQTPQKFRQISRGNFKEDVRECYMDSRRSGEGKLTTPEHFLRVLHMFRKLHVLAITFPRLKERKSSATYHLDSFVLRSDTPSGCSGSAVFSTGFEGYVPSTAYEDLEVRFSRLTLRIVEAMFENGAILLPNVAFLRDLCLTVQPVRDIHTRRSGQTGLIAGIRRAIHLETLALDVGARTLLNDLLSEGPWSGLKHCTIRGGGISEKDLSAFLVQNELLKLLVLGNVTLTRGTWLSLFSTVRLNVLKSNGGNLQDLQSCGSLYSKGCEDVKQGLEFPQKRGHDIKNYCLGKGDILEANSEDDDLSPDEGIEN